MDAQMRTIQKKRTANFREDETKLLIQLWGNPLIQNKLFLTHRKAPVMRILAANMQQRGFYRTPDEIKTRIRNLKCLYHRIKRTMACGTGIGTVDPDWPHFKAMDAILSKQGPKKDPLAESCLEGPKCEDIKQEIDIEFQDDLDSWNTNDSMGGSDYEENSTPLPPLQPAPTVTVKSAEKLKAPVVSERSNKSFPTIVPSFSLPSQSIHNIQTTQANGIRPGSSIPVPLLILNSLQPQQSKDKKDGGIGFKVNDKLSDDLQSTLKDLVDIQRQNLAIEKQRFALEKQRLEFDRLVGTQLVTLIPMIGGLLQRLCSTKNEELLDSSNSKRDKKRPQTEDLDIFKSNKILKTMLEQGIKQCMLSDLQEDGDDKDDSSDNEDSVIQNDDSNKE